MAHLPSGDMAERAKAHGVKLQPVPADQRGRCYVLTAFNSPNATLIEPTFSSELLHLLVFQQELTSGIDNGGHQYPHLQIYCIFRSRHAASKALRLLWPMSKNQSVYIAMARKGSSHTQLISYVQKPESRVPGTTPTLHGDLDEVVIKKEKPSVSNLDHIITTVQAQPSVQAAFTNPLTRRYASARPNWVSQIWQQRPESLPHPVASHPLLSWQRAVCIELQAMPSDDILWVNVQENSVKQALYIAKLIRAAAKERVLLVDASEPRAGIFHKASEQKDVVVITDLHGDAHLSLSTLFHLKVGLCSASTPGGSSTALATFNPRHVLVLTTTPIAASSKLRYHAKTLDSTDTSPTDGLNTLPPGDFITLAQPDAVAIQEANQHDPLHGAQVKPAKDSSTDADSDCEGDAGSLTGGGQKKRAKV
jgi:hypothetical protein